MKLRSCLVAAAAFAGLAACAPGAADYTESEWHKRLVLDPAFGELSVGFAPGTSRLLPGELERLRSLATGSGIVPSDRVVIAIAGPSALGRARFDRLAAALLPYGVVPTPAWLASAPPNRALVRRERYLVSLPACPDWSKPAAGAGDFTNTFGSNFGCADALNLGMTVAMPADLEGRREAGFTEGQPAAAAVSRHLNDRVVLPAAAKAGPFSSSASQSPAAESGIGSQQGTQQ